MDTTRFPNNDALALGYVTADDLDRISSPLMDDRYNRDARGRIRQVFPQPNAGRQFNYDSLGQLRRVMYGVPDGMSCYDDPDLGWICDLLQDSTIHFQHDPVGNRTLRSSPGGDAVGTYATGDRILTYGGCSYGTDFDGNVTSRTCGGESVTFGWSGDGRLTGYTIAGGPTVGLFYDAAGRLVRRDVNGSPASYFLWEGENLLAELDGGQYLVAQYSYYPGLDRLHAFNRSGSVSYAQADAEGNVRHLGTNVYNQVRSYVYDESGNLVGGADWGGLNGIDRARWKGALYLAPEAGLYYMRARWYEPRSGRFLSEDPIGLAGGLNPYIFAGADGINGSDPTGLDACEDGENGHWDIIGNFDDDGHGSTRRVWHHCGSNLPYDPSSMQTINECRDYVHGGTRDCPERFNVPEPPGVVRAAASSCGVSMGMFALTAATDLAFFTGVGVAMKGLRAISVAGRVSADYFERRMYQEAAVKMAEAGAMSWSTIPGRAGAYSVGAYAAGRQHQAAETWLSGEFHASDLIPGIASYNAWRRMRASCQ